MKVLKQLALKGFQADGGFIAGFQKLIREEMIPYQYRVLCDREEGVEKSHVVQNLINAGRVLRGEDAPGGFQGMVFQDSDAAKWLEAAAYSLSLHPDAQLEKTADDLIALIAAAQDEDGYLNTAFTVKDREKRWQNLLEGHELYCAGHMMEAACAYYEATGKDVLLRVMEKNADHIYNVFIRDGHPGYPGHPEVELALLKMYRVTGKQKYLALAQHFVDIRGVDARYYEKERAARTWTVWGSDGKNGEYQQSSAPVREQQDARGHAVRAVYLYTAMADLGAITGDETLLQACRRLWDSITLRQMYLTGGIGSTVLGEAFSVDYDLPGDTAYAETCASIGLMMFASRMLEAEADGRYADVMEQALYNTVLAGMQADGKRFFYVNPLEVVPGIADKAQTHRHVKPERPGWYACACCPPNVARLIGSLGRYAYGESADTAYCHLYAQGEVTFENGMALRCVTDYPRGFSIRYDILKGGRLALRIPGRVKSYTLTVNGQTADAVLNRGYACFTVADGDEVDLVLNEQAHLVYPSARVPQLTGRAALVRGPLVYCFEGVDNGGDVLGLYIDPDSVWQQKMPAEGVLRESVVLQAAAYRRMDGEELYTDEPPRYERCTATAVPYYLWGNRGVNQMRVWMGIQSTGKGAEV